MTLICNNHSEVSWLALANVWCSRHCYWSTYTEILWMTVKCISGGNMASPAASPRAERKKISWLIGVYVNCKPQAVCKYMFCPWASQGQTTSCVMAPQPCSLFCVVVHWVTGWLCSNLVSWCLSRDGMMVHAWHRYALAFTPNWSNERENEIPLYVIAQSGSAPIVQLFNLLSQRSAFEVHNLICADVQLDLSQT